MNVDLIREMCWANKITVSELERRVGLSNGTIHHWEKASPRVSTAKKVADFFGCTIDALLIHDKEAE